MTMTSQLQSSRIYMLAAFATLLSLALLPSGSHAFLVSSPESLQVVTPFLSDYARAQSGVVLHVDLDIPECVRAKHKNHSVSRLYINNLSIELKGDRQQLQQQKGTVALPQPTRHLGSLSRTGPLGLETHTQGTFVSVKGTQTVPLEHGCWEMSWAVGRPAGSLVCAFELTKDISRNDAMLPASKIYLSFPVFTKDGLEEMRLKKTDYEVTYQKHTGEQKEELEKVNETSNLFMKAVHFQRAVAANERASMMRTNVYESIPSSDDDIVPIGDELLLYAKGSVWSQGHETSAKEVFVGDAFLKK